MKNKLVIRTQMKRYIRLLTVFTFITTITSCVQDDDFSVPTSLGNEENQNLQTLLENGTEVSMETVKAMYQEGEVIEQITSDIYVKGYVTSSDFTGNFYKEFFIQDAPDNPTNALKVILNRVDSYNQFNPGREVYINLKGLYIGEERVGNGVTTIGGKTETDQYGTTVVALTENQIKTNLLRSQNTTTISPKAMTFSQISDDNIGMLISVDNVEFEDNLEGATYFDPIEDYDTQRTLQTCDGFGYVTFPLETSSFANFKDDLLPTGNGLITAIVNKTFDGSTLVLTLNNTEDVNLNNMRCSLLDPSDFTVIFEEDFQTAINNTNFDFEGWTNFNEEGNYKWREKTYSGNGYIEFSTYNSGSPVNIAWVVTPAFDMDAQDNEFLNFKTAQHHLDSPGNTIELFVSTNYNGTDVLAATWEPISANFASQSDDWYDFVDSGLIDLSSYSGTLHVAFKVVGSGTDTTLDGAYQIDDLSIIASN
ncbi:DUF5689 domain-containing protein [Mangrovimonas sp. TPBH4]|uniref:DUF5689 domain-containing protein n=1 Tax=Mangrovimonas sp. TPBH4 TaxID=1645914 RepID=UPI000B292E15|nr:DUF5689 domain-containing protein [Mangrovimonas sp. TPBH4]